MMLARVNTLLVVIIALINLLIIGLPVLPAILFSSEIETRREVLAQAVRTEKPNISIGAQQLIIPSIGMDAPIFEGTKQQLNNGVWRLPHTSSPDKESNTVLVAHRFTYTNPQGTFYHLDKVAVGDQIAVQWHDKQYTYRTTSIRQVKAHQIDIEKATEKPQLTLYTCTPLWNPKDRLVVTASLEAIK